MRRMPGLEGIPIIDAFSISGCCQMCALEEGFDLDLVETYMREFVMDPATRTRLVREGMCPHHAGMLVSNGDRLGAAISLESLLAAMIGSEQTCGACYVVPALPLIPRLRKALRSDEPKYHTTLYPGYYTGCLFCSNLLKRSVLSIEILVGLWSADSGFRQGFSERAMPCVPHGRMMADVAGSRMGGRAFEEFRNEVNKALLRTAQGLSADINWFIRKHDYLNAEASWNGSENAPERVARFMLGRMAGLPRPT